MQGPPWQSPAPEHNEWAWLGAEGKEEAGRGRGGRVLTEAPCEPKRRHSPTHQKAASGLGASEISLDGPLFTAPRALGVP